MPIVKVKGVANPISFPDDMDEQSIIDVLRNRFSKENFNRFNEPLLAVASSAIAEPIAGLAGLAQSINPFADEGAGARTVKSVQDALIINPSTEAGQQGLEDFGQTVAETPVVGDLIDTIAKAQEAAGEKAYQAGGPLAGALAEGAVGVLPDVLGLKAFKSAGKVSKTDLGTVRMFAGVGAKNAPIDDLNKAKKLADKGVDRDKIWKETGWFNDNGDWKFEIDDSFDEWNNEGLRVEGLKEAKEWGSAPQSNILNHPELYSKYPDMKEIRVSSEVPQKASASYMPNTDEIGLRAVDSGVDSASSYMATQSDNLHELQHAIQKREGFERGGSPEAVNIILNKSKSDSLKAGSSGTYRAKAALKDMGDFSKAEYIAKLDRLSKAENIKPSSITNLSDFYEYSDQIKEMFGAMPKSDSRGRLGWLKSAAAFIRNKNQKYLNYDEKMLVEEAIKNPKKIKSEYRKAERQFKKFQPDLKSQSEIEKKFKSIEGLSDYEKYKRLAGEAEARNVQTRLDWDKAKRREVPPWRSLDVPENELIYQKPTK